MFNMRFLPFFNTSLILTLSCFAILANAQSDVKAKTDSSEVSQNFVERMQAFAKRASATSAADLRADKSEQAQEEALVNIKKVLQKTKLYLRTGLDTVTTRKELQSIDNHHQLIGQGVFDRKKGIPTYRNLLTTEKILKVLLLRSTAQKEKLDNHKKRLSSFKYQLDSLSGIKALFDFPTDSAKLSKYIQALVVMAREVAPVNDQIDRWVLQTQGLQTQASLQLYALENSLEELNIYQKRLSEELIREELNPLWQPAVTLHTFSETLQYSHNKGKLNLYFYTSSNLGMIMISLALIVICYTFVLSLRKSYHKEIGEGKITADHLILNYPLVAAIFLIANLAQFLFNAPPFIFSFLFWVIAALSLTMLMKGYISRFWMATWLMMVGLFLMASLCNFLLQASHTERWYMLLLALAGIVTGSLVLKWGHRKDLREKLIVYAIALMVLLELTSVLFNCWGSYNLAKAFLVAGYVNVVIAIMFLWTVRLINQGLQLAVNLYAKNDKSLFFMNFDRVGGRAPNLLYILLIIGWLILFGRNFPAYAFIVEPVRNFFFDERSIGSYEFTISNLILFFFVVSISVIISRMVSFFAMDKRTFTKSESKRGLGSWILLIRITIIILGLFLAFAAVGIPIDKIAIVLGALGVGIGFGLQSLVNNLVSGLVIAFEKPLNLDDEVEIGGKTGTVKSIGFRSSVIDTADGAQMVIPNGDLLNSHLINWSSGAGRRRASLSINISHGADLQFIKEGIKQILSSDERILQSPEPFVFFQDINAEVLELRLQYWSRQTRQLAQLKSDMIIAINQFFTTHHIEPAYPKQELFVNEVEKKPSNKSPKTIN